MASVHHTFNVVIADDPAAAAAGEVLPSHWNAVHTLSGVPSQASIDAVSNAVSILSQTNSVDHVSIMAAVNVVSNAVSNEASVRSVAINVVSNAVSALSQANSVDHVSIRNLISIVSTAASNALSVANAASQAVSALSNANSAAHVSINNAISIVSNAASNALSVANAASNAASAASNNASINDASIWSAVSVLRSAITVHESAGGTSIRGMQSIINALSRRISAEAPLGGGGGSVTSTEVSAGDESVRNLVSVLSQQNSVDHASIMAAVNVVSANLASVNSDIRSVVSQLNSVVSQGISSLSNRISIVSQAVSIVSTAASNALSVANAASQAASVASNNASINDASIWSAVSVLRSAISAHESAGATSVRGLQSIIDAISRRISAEAPAGGGGGSVTSTEVSAGDASVGNLVSILSQAVSVAQAALSVRVDSANNSRSVLSDRFVSVAQAVSILSQTVSVLSADRVDFVENGGTQSLHIGMPVVFYNSAGFEHARAAYAGDASVVVGLAMSVIAVGGAGFVRLDGYLSLTSAQVRSVFNGASTFSAGKPYYVDAVTGQLSNAPPAWTTSGGPQVVAWAKEARGLQVTPDRYPAQAVITKFNDLSVADAALSARVDSVGNAVSVVSNALSNEISNRVSADNVLSNRISALSLNALANLSIVTPVDGNALMYNSATGEWHNSTPPAGGGGSVTSTEVSAGDASVANLVSILSQATSVAEAALSVRVNSVANAVSIVSANLASVNSDIRSVVSQLNSIVSVHSQAISVLSQQVSILSGKVSAGIGLSAQTRVRDAVFTVSTTGLTNIPSLSVSVEATGRYAIDVRLVMTHSALNAYGLGFTHPGAVQAAGLFFGNVSIVTANGFAGVFSATNMGAAAHGNAQTGVILLSGVAGSSAVPYIQSYRGVFHCSTAGSFQVQARVSLAGTPCIVHPGSYIRALRLA